MAPWRLVQAALCSLAIASPAFAQAPPSPAEQLRAKIVAILEGDKCLGFLPGTTKALTTALYIKACFQALDDELKALVLDDSAPLPPPGTALPSVTCTYAIDVPAPPQCLASVTPLP